MFGLRFRTRYQTLVALASLAGSEAGCSEAIKPGELGFRVGFACEEDRTQSTRLRLRLLRDGCDAGSETLYEASLGRGETAPAAANIAPGRYGIEATSYAANEEMVAYACLQVSLPSKDAIELELRSETCLAAPDADVPLDGALDAGLELDAEPEGDAAADDAETEVDAPPATCSSDCSDSDPCTDDVCVDGACTNPPFSGARECDGIPCTLGDMCAAGECQPGEPSDAACEDDGNPCTAEVCVANAGCNRSNAGADGRSCNDGIGCTSPDTCSNGICTGVDICSGSQVCSAAARMCISCTGPQDCDDNNPCTTDTCSVGQCSHSNNTASCNDGKSCTNNDVCAGGACTGRSTCPGDATCSGSTCSCNDRNETLCTASNTCVNLTNTGSDCGLCGRSCGSGNSCENSACKPAAATDCAAFRSGGHDYLVCDNKLTWSAALSRCRGFGLVLAVIESQAENDFLRDRLAGASRWIGANDRGNNGSNCRLSQEEGSWYWASSSSENGTNFCTASTSSISCTRPGVFTNWNFNEPNNGGSSCSCDRFGNCSEGQDCGSIDPPNGTWDDDSCGATLGYICETP